MSNLMSNIGDDRGKELKHVTKEEVEKEFDFLDAMGISIINNFGKEKSSIINPKSPEVQLQLECSDYMKSLLDNMSERMRDLSEVIKKLS